MIQVRDFEAVRAAAPFRVAHRGGVITPESPENTLRAIELAAEYGYAMVELDVMESADAEPVLLHDGLFINCGVDRRVCDLPSAELTQIHYRASDKTILSLADAIDVCARLGLGLMLDKLCRDDPASPEMSDACLDRVASLIRDAGLADSTVAIVDSPRLRERLADVALFRLPMAEYRRMLQGGDASLDGQFWFGWAAELPSRALPILHDRGLFAIVSINTFHYPHHAPRALAAADIQRLLAAGTDGFQIDSMYETCFA